MNTKFIALTLVAVLVAVLGLPAAALAQPSLPHYFYGALKINGADAPAGTTVEARATGAVTGSFNPIVTTQAGTYGSADASASVPRLLVQGSIAEGAVIEFYINGVRANQTAAWRSGQTQVLNLTAGGPAVAADIALIQGLDSMAYVAGQIVRFFNLADGATTSLPEGIAGYDAYLTYDAAGVRPQSVAGMAPFTAPSVILNATGGTRTSIGSSPASSGPQVSSPQPPFEAFRVYPSLTGSKDNVYSVTLHFNSITLTGGATIAQQADAIKAFRRGDTDNSGSVTIIDALFIAQYLAGIRSLGEGAGQVWPVNAATPRNDSTFGSTITITDALFIAQMLAGVRDAAYN